MTWLSTQQAAELCAMDVSTIQKSVKQNKYQSRYVKGVGRGGRVLEVALESLPDYAQARYFDEPIPEETASTLMEYPATKRNTANLRAQIVNEYRASPLSPDEYIERHNQENPDNIITKSQFYRWRRYLRNNDNNIEALIDNRGGHNRGNSSISYEQAEFFEDLYLRQQKLSVQRCWELTKITFEDIPSVSTFERHVKRIPALQRILYREGEKALNDALPHIRRKREGVIDSNDIWFSDHHICDEFVRNKEGLFIRPWLTVFLDARSNKIVGFLVREADPNVTAVKQCLRMGMEQYGIPSILYVDNGADYKSKEMTADYPLSLCNQLGIRHIFATPYHPEAKGAVERFFGIYEDRFGRLWPTYAGSDAKKRPEVLSGPKKKVDAYLQEYAPTLEEYIESVNVYINEYNHTPSNGIDMFGECPDAIYYSRLQVKREVDPDVIRLLCGRTNIVRTVRENYVRYENQYYINDILLEHIGDKVYITYDPNDMRTISVFTIEGVLICNATDTGTSRPKRRRTKSVLQPYVDIPNTKEA